jgi:hypothetical protein
MSKLRMTKAVRYFIKIYGMSEEELRKEYKKKIGKKSPHTYDFHIRWSLIKQLFGDEGIREVYNQEIPPKQIVEKYG